MVGPGRKLPGPTFLFLGETGHGGADDWEVLLIGVHGHSWAVVASSVTGCP